MRKPPGPKSTPSKCKVKKRNPWSDDESKSDSDVENSEPVIPRENKSQRASGTVRTHGMAFPSFSLYFIQQTTFLVEFLWFTPQLGSCFVMTGSILFPSTSNTPD